MICESGEPLAAAGPDPAAAVAESLVYGSDHYGDDLRRVRVEVGAHGHVQVSCPDGPVVFAAADPANRGRLYSLIRDLIFGHQRGLEVGALPNSGDAAPHRPVADGGSVTEGGR